MIGERIPIGQAVPLVCRGDQAGEADAIRYAVTKDLRKAGFTIRWKESRTVPKHVAIRWEGEWEASVSSRFDAAFREYEPGPGGSDE